jgi:hypothetical protein
MCRTKRSVAPAAASSIGFSVVAAQVTQKLGEQRLERRGREMLAAGKRREGRIEAEADDGRCDHGQPLDQLLSQRAGGERIGLERQMRAVRLGRGADRDHDRHARLEAGHCFGPGEILQPDTGIRAHAQRLACSGMQRRL